MAYGENKGVVTGQFGVGDYAGLAFSGAAGITTAAITDFFVKPTSSSLYVFNQWLVEISDVLSMPSPPLYAVIIMLVIVGAGSIFYFQPVTRRGAFAQGFGLLAALVTISPSDTSVQAESFATGGLEEPIYLEDIAYRAQKAPAAPTHGSTVAPADAKLMRTRLAAPAAAAGAGAAAIADQRYDIIFRVKLPNGLPDNLLGKAREGAARARVYNANTRRAYNVLGPSMRPDPEDPNMLVIPVGIPASASESSALIMVRLEIPGYEILETERTFAVGQRQDWVISMSPSNVPLRVQRLGRTFRF